MSRALCLSFVLSGALLALAGCDTAEQCNETAAPCPSCVRVATEAGCPTWTCPGDCAAATGNGSTSSDVSSDFTGADVGSPPTTPTRPPTTTSPPTTGGGGGIPYRYVRINDLSQADVTINAGSDIDAVVLDKPDGTQYFATTVEGFARSGGEVTAPEPEYNPNEALGAPDAFFDYPNVAVCDLERGFVTLGGVGGYLIVGMGAPIEAGDQISVLEIGGCYGNDGAEGIIEEIEVQVSVGFDVDEQWVTLGRGEGPLVVLTVPVLPVIGD